MVGLICINPGAFLGYVKPTKKAGSVSYRPWSIGLRPSAIRPERVPS